MSLEKTADDNSPAHGDVLELILTRVPLLDLASSSCVSRGWQRAVASSLCNSNTIKPWLILNAQAKSPPYRTATHAYDPRSDLWMDINQPAVEYAAALRSSHSTLLYVLSPSKFSFSIDPLHLTWRHVDAPVGWRTDPIVAMVGHRLIIAAGTCDFLDEPLGLLIYDTETEKWDTCDAMPAIFSEFATCMWFSIAVDDCKLFVMEKKSGVVFTFDPVMKLWCGPYVVNPNPDVFTSAVGFAGGRMVVVGVSGMAEDVKSVKIWEVEMECWECREMGEMPSFLVEKLKGESAEMASIAMNSAGEFVYIHNASDPVEVVWCEVAGDGAGGCRWGVVPNAVVNDRSRMRRLVFSSSIVGVGDLRRALRWGNRKIWARNLEKMN